MYKKDLMIGHEMASSFSVQGGKRHILVEHPIEINLEEVFFDKIWIRLDHKLEVGTYVEIDIQLNKISHKVLGQVIKVIKVRDYYKLELILQYIPDGLFSEVLEVVKDFIDDEGILKKADNINMV